MESMNPVQNFKFASRKQLGLWKSHESVGGKVLNGDADYSKFFMANRSNFDSSMNCYGSSTSDQQSLDSITTELDYPDFSWINAFDTSLHSHNIPNSFQHSLNFGFDDCVPIKSEVTTPPASVCSIRKRSLNKEEQQQKRRERNKVLARRTRLRKKIQFEGLKNQVMKLDMENKRLKEIVINKCGPKSGEILRGSCLEVMPDVVAACSHQATSLIQKSDFVLMKALHLSQPSFCVSDPLVPDCPIVFASESFIRITGYSRDQVLGRNCRFLQGPETDPEAVAKLREGIVQGKDTDVVILNYNANGESFWNHVFLAPLRDSNGRVINFVGIQHIISKHVDCDNPPNKMMQADKSGMFDMMNSL